MRVLAVQTSPSSPILYATATATATVTAVAGGRSNSILRSVDGKFSRRVAISTPTVSNSYGRKSKNLNPRVNAAITSSASGSDDHSNTSRQLAVLLEVEGVLVDVYRLGNRDAFNAAFKKMGLDCAHWTEPIYLDLVRKSIGGEEEMLILYFNKIGWPTSLPTKEKGTFMKTILREKQNALEDMVTSKPLPLRPGVEEFIDDAVNEGLPVVVLAAYSRNGEKIVRPIVERLGKDRLSKIKIVGNTEVEQSFYGQLVLGKGVSSSLDEQLANEARKAASTEKQRIAEEVASMLKLSVDLDTSSAESLQKIVAALRAGAEYAEVPVHNCVLVAGSLPGVAAAEKIGMPCVVLRSRLTARAEFPSAMAVLDSFGGLDLTVPKLRNLTSS